MRNDEGLIVACWIAAFFAIVALLLGVASLEGCGSDGPRVPPPCDCDAVCDPVKGECYCPTPSGGVDHICTPIDAGAEAK